MMENINVQYIQLWKLSHQQMLNSVVYQVHTSVVQNIKLDQLGIGIIYIIVTNHENLLQKFVMYMQDKEQEDMTIWL